MKKENPRARARPASGPPAISATSNDESNAFKRLDDLPARPHPSAHTKQEAIDDIELATLHANHAFQRWLMRCMKVTGLKDLTVVDVLVLHHINNRARNKRLADICFILNIEDIHIVTYSVRKLIGLELISPSRHGKDVVYSTTVSAREYLQRYSDIRESCLLDALKVLNLNQSVLEELAQYLRKMSGLYDQAARAVSSL